MVASGRPTSLQRVARLLLIIEKRREKNMLVKLPTGENLELQISKVPWGPEPAATHRSRLALANDWYELECRIPGGYWSKVAGTSHIDVNKMFNDVSDLIKDLESGAVNQIRSENGVAVIVRNVQGSKSRMKGLSMIRKMK